MELRKFFTTWKKCYNINYFEKRAGAKTNSLAHHLGKEKRPISPFDEGMILEKLAQLQRDINKLDPIGKINKQPKPSKKDLS